MTFEPVNIADRNVTEQVGYLLFRLLYRVQLVDELHPDITIFVDWA